MVGGVGVGVGVSLTPIFDELWRQVFQCDPPARVMGATRYLPHAALDTAATAVPVPALASVPAPAPGSSAPTGAPAALAGQDLPPVALPSTAGQLSPSPAGMPQRTTVRRVPSPATMPQRSAARRVPVVDSRRFPLPNQADGSFPDEVFIISRSVEFCMVGNRIVVFIAAGVARGEEVWEWVTARTIDERDIGYETLSWQNHNSGRVFFRVRPSDDEPEYKKAFRTVVQDLLDEFSAMMLGWFLRGYKVRVCLEIPGLGMKHPSGVAWPLGCSAVVDSHMNSCSELLRTNNQWLQSVPWVGPLVPKESRPPQPPLLVIGTDASWNTHTRFGGVAWVSNTGDFATDDGRFATIADAEREAVLLALKMVRRKFPHKRVLIVTDNKQVAKEFRHRDPSTPRTRVRWVRGHAGHPLNEGAHRLAMAHRRGVEFSLSAQQRLSQAQSIVEDQLAQWKAWPHRPK